MFNQLKENYQRKRGMETSIVGQDEAVEICNHALKSPTHMFFYGHHGLGKTTLVHDFLGSYAKEKDVELRDPNYFLFLTAEHDRGIHTVRAKLADFTRGTPKRKDVQRWVFIDDADSLPEVSQQALRRPMEQYIHLTCFIFVAHSSECLIHALQSRCQPIHIHPIPLGIYTHELLKRINYKIENEAVLNWLIATSISSVSEFMRMAKTLQWIAPENPTVKDVKEICSTHDYEKVIPLVNAIANKNSEKLYEVIGILWQDGMSFEDILHAIQQTAHLYFILSSESQERLFSFLVTGWAYHAQSRCSFLDLLCCAMDCNLL